MNAMGELGECCATCKQYSTFDSVVKINFCPMCGRNLEELGGD